MREARDDVLRWITDDRIPFDRLRNILIPIFVRSTDYHISSSSSDFSSLPNRMDDRMVKDGPIFAETRGADHRFIVHDNRSLWWSSLSGFCHFESQWEERFRDFSST